MVVARSRIGPRPAKSIDVRLKPDATGRGRYGRTLCHNLFMNSKRALGVVAVVAAVWAAARVVRRPAGLPQEPAAATSPAPDGKIALQFYRDPAPVGTV